MAIRAKPRKKQARRSRLRESVEQFQLAQEALGIVTWIWDIASGSVDWYGDASRMLGLGRGKFDGTFSTYLKHVHREDRARARATLVECLKGLQKEYRTVERVVWPDGSIHWLETYGRGTYNAEGRAVRIVGVIKEVTERKREESARAKAEKQLARVFDASPDYIVIVRAEDGKFVGRGAYRPHGRRAKHLGAAR